MQSNKRISGSDFLLIGCFLVLVTSQQAVAGGLRRHTTINQSSTQSTAQSTTQTPPPDWSNPEVGEHCPLGFVNDGANCSWAGAPIPTGTHAFIYEGNFYYTAISGSTQCPAPGLFHDGANCFVKPIPTDYTPFIYDNRFYVAKNSVFSKKYLDCPINSYLRGSTCLMGKLPWKGDIRRKGLVWNNYFLAEVNRDETCDFFKQGSQKLSFRQEKIIPGRPTKRQQEIKHYCELAKIPSGYTGLIYQGDTFAVTAKPTTRARWYIERKNLSGVEGLPRPVGGLSEENPERTWTLAWSDEFSAGNLSYNDRCRRSNARAHCTEWFYWRDTICANSPTDWTPIGKSFWTSDQHERFDGLSDLDKCTWKVADAFDFWSVSRNAEGYLSTPPSERISSYSPKNVSVSNGVLKLKATESVKSNYDCGRVLNGSENPTTNDYSSDCPISGSFVWSPSGDPWNNGNSISHSDPAKRYVGKTLGYGKIEVRANIVRMGRLAWPSIWLWGDRKSSEYGHQNTGEIDILEFLGKDHWLAGSSAIADPGTNYENEVLRQAPTHGWAYQTLHNWTALDETDANPDNDNDHPHHAATIPIGVGEWHVYAVEYEPSEIRFYIDGVLRNRIMDGQALENGKTFRIPRDQQYHIILGTGARPSTRWKSWYKDWQEGRASESERPSDFIGTEFHVDYIRYYTAPEIN